MSLNKITWLECSVKEWLQGDKIVPLYVTYGEYGISHGIFIGYDKLNTEELKVLENYTECFYYHGKPCNLDDKDGEYEDCECVLGNNFGSLTVGLLLYPEDDLIDRCLMPLLNDINN